VYSEAAESVEYSEAESVSFFLRGGPTAFPAMESLKLRSNEDFGMTFWSTVDIFKAPSLRRVALHLWGDPMTLPLHWGQLTELDLRCSMVWPRNNTGWDGGLSMQDVVKILTMHDKLIKCRLHITDFC
jgi:hypothetical protein